MLLKFGVDIQNQTEVRVWKQKTTYYGHQVAIFKVTSLKIYKPLPIATNNVHMKFEQMEKVNPVWAGVYK